MSSFILIRKQYIAMAMIVFVLLFLLNNKPSEQCESRVAPAVVEEEVRSNLPIIYGITPTYARLAQKADLTRLSQTLMLVKSFHWIIIEDSKEKTPLVANLLKESKLQYTHLNAKTIVNKQLTASGVEQRNAGLDWLKNNLKSEEQRKGIVYFMDDDNTYALKLFDEIRKVKKVGMWPVGLVGGMRVEMPIVNQGKIAGFNAVWKPFRPFPIDMAGFAINVSLILDHPEAKFSRKVQSGYQESEILKYVATIDDLEPLAENCTKVYVWHTRTQKPNILSLSKLKVKRPDDSHIEV